MVETERNHGLTEMAKEEIPSAVAFGVQRPDADSISPNTMMDPEFAQALKTFKSTELNYWLSPVS